MDTQERNRLLQIVEEAWRPRYPQSADPAKTDRTEPPLTPRQIANRANGAKSHGPKTPEGKAISSQNARKHGLCATHEIVIATDPAEEFEALQAEIHERLRPTDAMQRILVERIVACSWRMRRAVSIETAHFERNVTKVPDLTHAFDDGGGIDTFLKISRYEIALERSIYRALQALALLQSPAVAPPVLP